MRSFPVKQRCQIAATEQATLLYAIIHSPMFASAQTSLFVEDLGLTQLIPHWRFVVYLARDRASAGSAL